MAMMVQVLRPQEFGTIIIRATKSYLRPELTLSQVQRIIFWRDFYFLALKKCHQQRKKGKKKEHFHPYKKENAPLPLNTVRLLLVTSK